MKNITKLEADFLNAVINSENGMGCEPEWNWFEQIEFDRKQGRALATSLNKKGILIVDDTDTDDDFAGTYICIKDDFFIRIDDNAIELTNIEIQ